MLTTLLNIAAAQSIVTPYFGTEEKKAHYSFTIHQAEQEAISNLKIRPYYAKDIKSIKPLLKASAALSFDLESGQIYFEQNANERLPMASITKLMTALVILEKHDLNEIISITREATLIEPAKIYLKSGEEIDIENLIKAILIKSANDAALALAIHSSGSVEEFVSEMNKKAIKIGLHDTHFNNPTGFDDDNQYSTAKDISKLAKTILKFSIVRDTVKEKESEIISNNGKTARKIINTNQLFDSYLNVLGMKTGTTPKAGACLISITEHQNGQKIMNILLNSPNRFQESKVLTEWVLKNYYPM